MARNPRKVGSYAVDGTIGRGGMGEVFQARHEVLDRPVALKRLSAPDPAAAEHFEERFRREGRALAQLSHQGICGVYDLFSWRGDFYMALELIDGQDLERLLAKGALPVDVAALIALRVVEALEHAHFHGIIHRDVKPANIMVSKLGDVKLMDFGVARDDALESVTKTGMVVGTPAYLAPEVLRGEPADERNDLYAVGATLYYMLSGRKLFAHATPENVYHLIAQGRFPPIGSVTKRVPRSLRRIVGRCLEKRPARRYDSASELRHDLERFLSTHCAWANGNERLVAYLAATGHLSEEEALTHVNAEDLVISLDDRLVRPWRRRLAAAAFLLVGGALLAWSAGLTPAGCSPALEGPLEGADALSPPSEDPGSTP